MQRFGSIHADAAELGNRIMCNDLAGAMAFVNRRVRRVRSRVVDPSVYLPSRPSAFPLLDAVAADLGGYTPETQERTLDRIIDAMEQDDPRPTQEEAAEWDKNNEGERFDGGY